MLRDSFGRLVDYLRVSVTDRCNLRCTYCMPPEGVPRKPREEILTSEELARAVRVAASLGIRKVRVTGGEPLVRRNLVPLVRSLSEVPGIADLCMTTNGVGLAQAAETLKRAGLGRVNISLDTLRRERFAEITRRDLLPEVLEGIESALRAGLVPLKINVVLLAGLTGSEVDDFLGMAREKPVEVRFIERMPAGCVPSGGYVSGEGVRERILSFPGVVARPGANGSAARIWRIPGFRGTVGLISPISGRFCAGCNRLRITADGRLLGCLQGGVARDLRAVLRDSSGDDRVADLFREAASEKPREHGMGPGEGGSLPEPMSRVGG